jgi:asparagine synthase (glutamine-hydrolysing)
LQYFRIKYPNIPERIEETSLLAEKYGLTYVYPFLDIKLLEFFYSLPSEFKFKDGVGRILFRQAMKGILPEEIRNRKDKGGNTIPNVFIRVLKDEGLFRELIEEGRQNNQFHYVDYNKLHDMLDSFKAKGRSNKQQYSLRAFQSPISVLLLQKQQREGKIDIGIKC